ncbi:hypothetical protein B0H67DRAFT_640965 [Lasiosphaeris hirsuta]|uniref:Uncharacterized protein n=1 Tax=Lasiosphaeris hirsuta TaxID=260670 RepID=A0AA40AYN2_9PEZI|nr:hypothetical protein B0H67DRAFT_640965 [Lasiosphaeris hirsuta]
MPSSSRNMPSNSSNNTAFIPTFIPNSAPASQGVALVASLTAQHWKEIRLHNEEAEFARERANPNLVVPLYREPENFMINPARRSQDDPARILSHTRLVQETKNYVQILACLTGGCNVHPDPYFVGGWYRAWIDRHMVFGDVHGEVESFLPRSTDGLAQWQRRVLHFRRRMFCENLGIGDPLTATRWLTMTVDEVLNQMLVKYRRAVDRGYDFDDMVRQGAGGRRNIITGDLLSTLLERDESGQNGLRWRPREEQEPILGRPRTVIPTQRFVVMPVLDENRAQGNRGPGQR